MKSCTKHESRLIVILFGKRFIQRIPLLPRKVQRDKVTIDEPRCNSTEKNKPFALFNAFFWQCSKPRSALSTSTLLEEGSFVRPSEREGDLFLFLDSQTLFYRGRPLAKNTLVFCQCAASTGRFRLSWHRVCFGSCF